MMLKLKKKKRIDNQKPYLQISIDLGQKQEKTR